MYTIDSEKVPTEWSNLIKEVLAGEEIVITQANEPILKLSPILKQKKIRRRRGSAKGLIKIHDDFDTPLDEFADYMP